MRGVYNSEAQCVYAKLDGPQQWLTRLDINNVFARDEVVRCGDHAVKVGFVVSWGQEREAYTTLYVSGDALRFHSSPLVVSIVWSMPTGSKPHVMPR